MNTKINKAFKFRQNNSGGLFGGNHLNIYIVCDSEEKAIEIAENQTKIYFDGCFTGEDCSCCGDRWSRYCDEEEFLDIRDFQASILGREFYYESRFIEETERSDLFWNMKNLILVPKGFLKDDDTEQFTLTDEYFDLEIYD